MCAHHIINLNKSIQKSLESASVDLQTSLTFALVAERLGKLPNDLDLPPSDIPLGLIINPKETTDTPPMNNMWPEIKETFAQYCTRYAIIQMITVCESYLQQLLFFSELAYETCKNGALSGNTVNEIREACRKTIRHSSVDGLPLIILRTVSRDISYIPRLQWFRSIYALRKCLVHRGGVVGKDDVNDSGILEATWIRMILTINDEEIKSLPYTVGEGGGKVTASTPEETRTWKVGDKIILSAADCQNVAISLLLFSIQMADELQKGLSHLKTPNNDL